MVIVGETGATGDLFGTCVDDIGGGGGSINDVYGSIGTCEWWVGGRLTIFNDAVVSS